MSMHHRKLAAVTAVLLIAVAASITVALAASTKTIVKAKANTSIGKTIVVDAKGKTVYRLSGETSTKFKCTSSPCLTNWPPLTVTSKTTKLKAGTGVRGKLTVVKRSGVKGFQVLLGGKPLYHFIGDTAAGDAKGNGLNAFGGIWNVLGASGGSSSAGGSTTTTSSTPAPVYPSY